MLEKRIKVPFENVDWIAHTADIHIRRLQRHSEYVSVFKEFYEKLKAKKGNGIIYLGGDIVHAKIEMSPELISLTNEFFRALAEIAPLVLIAGNHDANLNNISRMDALTPLIDGLAHPNIFYLRDSGVYHIADVSFAVMSVFDEMQNYIKANDFEGTTKIALFHGPIVNSVADSGIVMTSNMKLSRFDGYDMALLGDIHKTQFFGKNNTIAYPGSLIRQTPAEDKEKGFLFWDVATRTSEFVPVKNEHTYYTLEINDGEMPIVDDMPKFAKLRLKCTNTSKSEAEFLQSKIKSHYGINNITMYYSDSLSNTKLWNREGTLIEGNVNDVNHVNNLVAEYLPRMHPLSIDLLPKILDINKTCFDALETFEEPQNVFWNLKKFRFSNMFSYGEDNVVDFSKFNDIVGLFAPNASGKSALLDSLTFCLFDTSSRAFKATDILNNKKDWFECEVEFEIDGIEYGIKRQAKKNKTSGKAPVSVDFWLIGDDNEKVMLNGDQRRSTNVNIRNVIGTYEDFVVTSMSPQNDSAVFIDKKQKDKLEMMAQFLGLGIFEKLYIAGNENMADVRAILKTMRDRDYDQELAEADVTRKQYTTMREALETRREAKQSDLEASQEYILELHTKLKQIDSSITDIDGLSADKIRFENGIKDSEKLLRTTLDVLEENRTNVEQIKAELVRLDKLNVNADFEELVGYEDDRVNTQAEIDKLKIEVTFRAEQLAKLEIETFNEECNVCMDRAKDSLLTKAELEGALSEHKAHATIFVKKINQLDFLIEDKSGVRENKNRFDELKHTFMESNNRLMESETTKVRLVSDIQALQNSLSTAEENIKQYYLKEQDIISNVKITAEIDTKKTEEYAVKVELATVQEKLQRATGEIERANANYEQLFTELKNFQSLEDENLAYGFYLDAVKRNGITYELIANTIPSIEHAVNDVLEQIVDFKILISMPGKTITPYIVYDENNAWPLELTSGMEKFVSSLAIRVGLINVCNLPRNNALFLDEGFGSLDADNLNTLHQAFQFLKSQFQFVAIISHLESMRDMVDSYLDISKEDGFSVVNNT